MDKDAPNKGNYQNNISILIKEENIHKRIKLVNESKIFVDTKSIFNNYLDIFNEKFDRYNKLKDVDLEFYDLALFNDSFDFMNEYVSNKISADQEKKQKYLIFQELVITYIKEFLHNQKYGLDKFLGSRIRHGILENNLLKPFKSHKLLSLKLHKEDSDYNIDEYWEKILNNKNNENEKFKSLIIDKFSNFSKKIIDKISEANEWIRIKDNEHPEGVFNYILFFTENFLTPYFAELQHINDFKLLYENLNNELWDFTESILVSVRKKINTELYDYFIHCLDEFKLEIENLSIFCNISKEITTEIELCKTTIKFDLNTVSNWFYLRKNDDYNDYDLDELTRTCLDINLKVNHRQKDVCVSCNNNDKILLKGTTFNHMYDIINMLYSNAINHSGFKKHKDIEIKIISKILNNKEVEEYLKKASLEDFETWQNNFHNKTSSSLILKVSNKLECKLDHLGIMEKVERAINKSKNLEDSKAYITNEGGSGLIKINNILKYNIARSAYSYLYYIDDKNYFNAEIILNLHELIAERNSL